jgi:hypothetical protein
LISIVIELCHLFNVAMLLGQKARPQSAIAAEAPEETHATKAGEHRPNLARPANLPIS